MERQSRRLPSRRIVYPLALGVGVLLIALVVQRVKVVHVTLHVLRGTTAQRTPFDLGLSAGIVGGLRTSLTARCDDGDSWTATWAPVEGNPVHFKVAGQAFSTSEVWRDHRYPNGVIATGGFVMNGRMSGAVSAEGTVRLAVRFNGGAFRTSCDSGLIRWAVGTDAATRRQGATS